MIKKALFLFVAVSTILARTNSLIVLRADVVFGLSDQKSPTKIESDIHEEILSNLKNDTFYKLIFKDNCTIVYDFNGKILYQNNEDYPFSKDDTFRHVFVEYDVAFRFLCTDEIYIWQPSEPDYRIPINNAFNCLGSFEGECDPITGIPYYACSIDNFDYFLKLKHAHGYNSSSYCSIISIQILCGYFDTILSDSFVSEKWDWIPYKYNSTPTLFSSWTQSSGTGYELEEIRDSRFRDYLIQSLSYSIDNGMTFYQQKSLLENYLNGRGIQYTINSSEGNFQDLYNHRAVTVIKQAIDNNYPLIANGYNHSTVAFAYDNDYVYVHTGWGYCARITFDAYIDWSLTCIPSAICIMPASNHTHSNNYFTSYNNHFYCSCGNQMPSSLIPISSLNIAATYCDYPTTGVYQSTFNAGFCYVRAYKENNNICIINGGEFSITFDSQIAGLSLEAKSLFDGNNIPSIYIDYINSSEIVTNTYNADLYTYLNINDNLTKFAINCANATRTIRFRIIGTPSSNAKLIIKKMVFGIC